MTTTLAVLEAIDGRYFCGWHAFPRQREVFTADPSICPPWVFGSEHEAKEFRKDKGLEGFRVTEWPVGAEVSRALRHALADRLPDLSPSAVSAIVASRGPTDTVADLVQVALDATCEFCRAPGPEDY